MVRRIAIQHHATHSTATGRELELAIGVIDVWLASGFDATRRGRLREAAVRGKLVALVGGHVDGHPRGTELHPDRLDQGPRHRARGGCGREPGGDAPDQGDLRPDVGHRVGPVRSDAILDQGGAILDEQPQHVAATEAAVATGIDAIGGQAPGIGPRADRVRMHAEDACRLGDAEEGASLVFRHGRLVGDHRAPSGRMELLVGAVHRMLET